MSDAALHVATSQRLTALEPGRDAELDDLAALAGRVFDVPNALIALVHSHRQWFTASARSSGADPAGATAHCEAYCDQAVVQRGILLVEDAMSEPRFTSNGSVTGEEPIGFYAGAPLLTTDGQTVGVLCVFDDRPRPSSPYQQAMLLTLADQVARHVELRVAADGAADSLPRPTAQDWVHASHLKKLVMEGHIGYLEVTEDGLILGVNQATCRMFGYREDELVGTSARRLTHPDHSMDTDAAVADLASGRRSFYDATRVYRHRTGRKLQVRVTVSHIPSSTTRPAGMATLLVDLSAQVNADTLRVVAERDRRRVLDTAADAYVSIDGHGIVQDWNAAAERLFGFPAHDAVGRELAALILPEHLAGAHRDGVARAAAGGEPTLIGQPLEVPARHRDGSVLQIELTVWKSPLETGGHLFHAFCRDISERVASRAALTEANQLLRHGREQLKAAFEASPTADAVMDEVGRLVDVNPAMCRFLGVAPAELIGRRWAEVIYEPDGASAESALAHVLTAGRPLGRTEMRFFTADGRVVWGMVSLIPMDAVESIQQVMLRVEDIQAHKELERTLARQASHDPISGLPNRSLFLERVRQAVIPRGDGSLVGVLAIQVDGLQPVIDRSGYAASDRVLSLVAERMGADLGDGVTLAHLQPGLFGAVMPGGVPEAARLSNQFLTAIRAPIDLPGGPLSLRASIGISVGSPSTKESAAQVGRLVQDAENAAQVARADGGDCAVFAAAEMRDAQQRQGAFELLIRDALATDQIHVAYQPVFDLTTGRMVATEALLRMFDRDGRPVPPLDVVPVAEASGLIVDIGRRVLHIAARQVAQWQEDHGILVPVAVNVSAVQLVRPDFHDDVLAAIDMAGVPPGALSLELTESVLLKSGSPGIEQLRDLRNAGINLAIDDFGTGYASLSYLRDMPASTLKIDRTFVEGIPHDHGAMAIVAGVIALAKNFGMTCIAEGIETELQLEYLAERGVMGQGYLLARPVDGSAIGKIIAMQRSSPADGELPSVADARDSAGGRRDQTGDERDQAADQRDQAAQRRDEAAERRDEAGDRRDEAGDQRDQASDERDQASDQRDQASDNRDQAGDQRDQVGDHRDQVADQRDQDSDDRDHPAEESEASTRAVDATDGVEGQALAKRVAAASDRRRASRDRRAGATERTQAELDRDTALTDRGTGANERSHAEHDRQVALADRGAGASDRSYAELDRNIAHADRGASERTREYTAIDPVTGVYLRGAGLVELAREIVRASRTEQRLVLAFLKSTSTSTSTSTDRLARPPSTGC